MLSVSTGCPDCRLACWLVWGWVGGRGDEPGLVRDDALWCVSGLFCVLPPPPQPPPGSGLRTALRAVALPGFPRRRWRGGVFAGLFPVGCGPACRGLSLGRYRLATISPVFW